MYEIIKSVIESGRYDLPDMIKKIDTCWIQGDISEDEKNELKTLATQNATPSENENELLRRVVERVEVLEEKVKVLENGGAEPEPPQEECQQWTPCDGVNPGKYMKDAKVTHNGKKYISLVDNNVWEPGVTGTETVWKLLAE